MVSLDAAEELIQLADAYGVADGYPLAESQKITLRLACGERADGSWAATRVADFGPRQGTGKNDKIAARELAGLLLFGEELILHTAHEFPTANEAFLRLVAVFENWDDLRSKVARVRYANGEQGIELLSGQRLKYRARTGGSGRGFAKADLVVYDEAQHLAREHVAASGPTKLANPNSQTWYAGSGGHATSHVAWAVRRDALAGHAGRLAYTEMTAEDLAFVDGKVVTGLPDPLDRDVWYETIPGLGRWVSEEGVAALYDELGPALFMREILCVWDPDPHADAESIIPEWDALVDADSRIESHRSIALDITPDRRFAALAWAGRRADGLLHVEAFDHRPGTGWVLAAGQALTAKWRLPIKVQSGSPAAALIAPLREVGVTVEEVTAADHAKGLGQLLDAAASKQVWHIGGQALTSAVKGAEVRTVGETDVLARRSSKVDISPLVAVVLAVSGVPSIPSRPLFVAVT